MIGNQYGDFRLRAGITCLGKSLIVQGVTLFSMIVQGVTVSSTNKQLQACETCQQEGGKIPGLVFASIKFAVSWKHSWQLAIVWLIKFPYSVAQITPSRNYVGALLLLYFWTPIPARRQSTLEKGLSSLKTEFHSLLSERVHVAWYCRLGRHIRI